jgi:hypothetical protein
LRYSIARASYISATADRPLRLASVAMRCTNSARSSMIRSAKRKASSTRPALLQYVQDDEYGSRQVRWQAA